MTITKREREVIDQIPLGSNKVIGRALGITENTVRTHLYAAYRKLGLTSRVQAALWAHGHGR